MALGLLLRVAEGTYLGVRGRWLRWQTEDGTILPTGAEAAEMATARAEQEKARAEQEKARAERLAAQLRALGIDPEG